MGDNAATRYFGNAALTMRQPSASRIVFLILIWAGSVLAQANISAISSAIDNGTSEQKRDALFAIKNLRSEPSSRAALPALADRDEIVRATAASAIVYLPADEAVRALEPLLNDKSPFVRHETALALGKVGDRRATASLERLTLKDADAAVRTAAVSGLGSIGDPASIATLIAILKRKPTEDDEMLRRSAARAIGQVFHLITFGNTKIVTPQNFLPDTYKSLGDVLPLERERTDLKPDFDAAKATLGNVLQNKKEADDVRREAAFALGESRDPAASSLLRLFLRSADPYLAEICKEGLLKIEARAGLTRPSGN